MCADNLRRAPEGASPAGGAPAPAPRLHAIELDDALIPAAAEGRARRVALVGHPNVGKSVIFSRLTGSYVTCSNYPGTTVQIYRGTTELDGAEWEVLDTPGLIQLASSREDEQVTRDVLLFDDVDVVVQVADAKNLERTLTLFLQLAELGRPMVLNLNMVDESRARGIEVPAGILEQQLGVPVIETVATHGIGVDDLRAAVRRARVPKIAIDYGDALEAPVSALSTLLSGVCDGSARGVATLLLAVGAGDAERLLDALDLDDDTRYAAAAVSASTRDGRQTGYEISQCRHRVATELSGSGAVPHAAAGLGDGVHSCGVCGPDVLPEFDATGATGGCPIPFVSAQQATRFSRALGRWSVHPVWGVAILLAVMFAMYELVGNFGAVVMVGFLEDTLFGQYINPAVTAWVNGALPWSFARDLLVGEYGIWTMAITYSVALILPIVATFFLAFGFLEDSGYFPRLTVIAHRTFRRMGLSGQAVLPMILGLSCDTMATVTTRVLETRKERTIATLLLALGVPCSAQLAVLLAISASVSGWVMIGVLVITGLQLLIVGRLAAALIPGRTAPFVTELPPLRWPQWRNILAKTRARMFWYLTEVVPLFIIGTLALFLLDQTGALAAVQRAARPVVTGLLGLPGETSSAFVMGFFRRDYGAAGLYQIQQAGGMDALQVLVSLVVITLFVPCVANLLVIIKERGWKTALAIVGFIVPYSIFVGAVVNAVARGAFGMGG
jgi:ferrous iron transport protein B